MVLELTSENKFYHATDDRASWRDFYMDAWRSLASQDDLKLFVHYLINYLDEDDLVDLGARVACMLEVKNDIRS